MRFSCQFIQNLQKVDRIVPFLRAWVPEFRCLVGFLVSLDGGKAGYGSTIHALAGREEADPADSLTKLYRDPVTVINSEQYRYGPPLFGSLDQIEEDTVVVCKNGTFQFQGLPEKFLSDMP